MLSATRQELPDKHFPVAEFHCIGWQINSWAELVPGGGISL
jgi:hypothetical protein